MTFLAHCSYFSQTLPKRKKKRHMIRNTCVKTDICCMYLCNSLIPQLSNLEQYLHLCNCQFRLLCNVYKDNLINFPMAEYYLFLFWTTKIVSTWAWLFGIRRYNTCI
jgi:hypothetical protein